MDTDLLASLCGNCVPHGSDLHGKGLHMDVFHAMAEMMVPYSLHIY